MGCASIQWRIAVTLRLELPVGDQNFNWICSAQWISWLFRTQLSWFFAMMETLKIKEDFKPLCDCIRTTLQQRWRLQHHTTVRYMYCCSKIRYPQSVAFLQQALSAGFLVLSICSGYVRVGNWTPNDFGQQLFLDFGAWQDPIRH